MFVEAVGGQEAAGWTPAERHEALLVGSGGGEGQVRAQSDR